MKIAVVGTGGREHALVWKLAQSLEVTDLVVTSGSNAIKQIRLISNGQPVRCLPFGVTETETIVDFACMAKYDLVVPGPESCLAAGLGDCCRECGIPFAGPCSRGARLETSKAFAHRFLAEARISHPIGSICETVRSAREFAAMLKGRCAVKADGLAGGKGVILATDIGAAFDAIERLMIKRQCGDAGNRVVVQELEEGEEVSLQYITDAKQALMLATSRDYKRVGVNDSGENTGGMGGYSPGPILEPNKLSFIQHNLIEPWRAGCKFEEIIYRGILYPGIILTKWGVKVLEFNVRFGDPEAELLMRRFTGDLARLLYASATDSLDPSMISWAPESSVCIVMCSRGYPGPFDAGFEITGLQEATQVPGVEIFHMGTRREGEKWITKGGRVLAVTALRKTRAEAREACLQAVGCIHFEGSHFRDDIAT